MDIKLPSLFNAGLSTIYANFRNVDYQGQLQLAKRNFEATIADYAMIECDMPMRYNFLDPTLSCASTNTTMQAMFESNSPSVDTGTGPAGTAGYYTINNQAVQLLNGQFNKLTALMQANMSMSDTPLFAANLFVLNDHNTMATSCASYTQYPKINTGNVNPVLGIMLAIDQNMLDLVSHYKMYSAIRYVLKYFADKHVALSSYLMQAQAAIQSKRFTVLLDKIKSQLKDIPCDVDGVDNYSKRILPSRTGNSGYDPILIPILSIAIPCYQVSTKAQQNPFTLGAANSNGQSEYSISSYGEGLGSGSITASTNPSESNYNIYFLNYNNRRDVIKNPAVVLLDELENVTNSMTSDMGSSILSDITQQWISSYFSSLQMLSERTARLLAMATSYIGFGQLCQRSNLTKLRTCEGEGDYDVTYHYDGFIGDCVKHPEVRPTKSNSGRFVNNANQFTAQIACTHDHYDGHLVDSVAIYNVANSVFWNSNIQTTTGDFIGQSPFLFDGLVLPVITNVAKQTPECDINYIFKSPDMIISDTLQVMSFCGGQTTFTETDADQTVIKYNNGQKSYGQQGWVFYSGYVNNLANSMVKYLGIVMYGDTNDDGYITGNLTRLYTSDYTSIIPVTMVYPQLEMQEGLLNHMPFVTTLKTNAQKVVSVAA